MKKIVTASVALLSVITLAACSGKSTSESSDKASSSVEKTSTSKSSSSSSETSSKTASSDLKTPEIVLLTDEEIDNTEIGNKVPEARKEAYNQQVQPAIESMETSRETFNNTLSAAGPDDTVVPEQSRNLFLQQLKTGRDAMKQAIEGAYKSLAPLISGQ